MGYAAENPSANAAAFTALRDAIGASPAPTLGFLGHSIPAAGVSNTATETRNANYGMQYWVPALAGQRIRSKHSLNKAVAGATALAAQAQIAPMIAAKPNRVIVDIGRNDTSFQNFIDGVVPIYDALLGAGIAVDAIPLMPTNLTTASTRGYMQRSGAWLREQGQKGIRNFNVIDCGRDYGDPLSANFAPKSDSGNTYDQTHPAGLGGYRISKTPAAFYRQIYPEIVTLLGVADQYDAAHFPGGNLIPNGILDGTGGTLTTNQGVTTTGSVMATGWAMIATTPYTAGSPLSGLTMTATKAALDAYGAPGQRVTFSGGYTGDVGSIFGIRWSGGAGDYANLNVGDWVEATAEVELLGGTVQQLLSGIQLGLFLTMGGTLYAAKDGYAVTSGLSPKEGYKVTLRTPPIQITAVPTLEQVTVYAIPTQGAQTFAENCVFETRYVALRKVSAP